MSFIFQDEKQHPERISTPDSARKFDWDEISSRFNDYERKAWNSFYAEVQKQMGVSKLCCAILNDFLRQTCFRHWNAF